MFGRTRRPRDSQKSRVYRAESVLPRGKVFDTVPEMQAYVDKIVNSRWWKRRFPRIKRIEVKDGRGRSSAGGWSCGSVGYITMPKWSRSESIVLHEMAHTLGVYGAQGHGPEYCALFKMLVERWMGEEASRALGDSFRKHRVECRFLPFVAARC